jgi:integrase
MATSIIYLDTRRIKNDSTYPVKIRVTHTRKSMHFPTKYSLTEKEFNKIQSEFRLSETQETIKGKLDALKLKANKIIEDLEPFSFDTFSLRFTTKGDRADLLFLLYNKAIELRNNNKHANANLYQQAADLLKRYIAPEIKTAKRTKAELNKENTNGDLKVILPIANVTKDWLEGFEKWGLKKGYSATTIGMYLIRVRAIFNISIGNNELKSSCYPFHKPGNKGYIISTGSENKRALTLPQIMLIYNFNSDIANEQFARDIFIFSYLANGMNTYDVWRLKWSDIKDNQFTFIRKKTEHTKKGKNVITVSLNEHLWEIIDRQGSRKINNDHIFNVIKPGMEPRAQMNAVKATTTMLNTYLKIIASKTGLTNDISTYYARHSWATILMNSKAPLAFIRSGLGHTSLSTTEKYLGGFTPENAEEYTARLLQTKA